MRSHYMYENVIILKYFLRYVIINIKTLLILHDYIIIMKIVPKFH